MSETKTFFQLSGRGYAAATLSNATLLVIDAQEEYRSGVVRLPGLEAAMLQIGRLLEVARAANTPVVHVRHLGVPGGLFDPQGNRGQFLPEVAPLENETVIGKSLPNAFANTGLAARLEELGHLDLIVCGFMSHSSVSSTVRAAKDYGYRCTLVDDACATRDLPSAQGVISADTVHRAEMTVMADNFATVTFCDNLV